ncbi:glutamate-5-semialdehyde dehydrogenase [Helicobacter sp. 23-1045]
MELLELLQRTKDAQKIIANLQDTTRIAVLDSMADEIVVQKEMIIKANAVDLKNAESFGLSAPMIERLKLDSHAIDLIANALNDIARLKSPLGRVMDGWVNYKGLHIQKVSVPIGVIAMIYESRPNVTSDSFALCFKSGNVCVLKGGKEAINSNKAIVAILQGVLERFSLPKEAICFVENREATEALLKCDKIIDLVIPRGGEKLIRFVAENSTIPVIKHDKGVCHLYIHSDSEAQLAIKIALNAKISKPSACNSIECILVHNDFAHLAELVSALQKNGVAIHADKDTANRFGLEIADESDFYNEYNDLVVNLKCVDCLESAIAHIAKYGSSHSEAILTNDLAVAQTFADCVDSACVFINSSTRFCDGGEFGFGAEIGISTSKLHARGPMGIESLVSYKYKIFGNGEARE